MFQRLKDTFNKDSELFKAINALNLDRVNLLLENNADPNKSTGDGVKPLSRAIRLYNTQKMVPDFDQERFDTSYAIIRALVEKGADVNIGADYIRYVQDHGNIDMRTQTPLILGLKEFDTKLLDYLIDNRANVNLVTTDKVYQNGYTYTPLTWVLENFNKLTANNPRLTTLEAVRYLLSRGADPKKGFEYLDGKNKRIKSPLTLIDSYVGTDKDEIRALLFNPPIPQSVNKSMNPLIPEEGGRRRRRKTNKKRKTSRRRKTGKRRRR